MTTFLYFLLLYFLRTSICRRTRLQHVNIWARILYVRRETCKLNFYCAFVCLRANSKSLSSSASEGLWSTERRSNRSGLKTRSVPKAAWGGGGVWERSRETGRQTERASSQRADWCLLFNRSCSIRVRSDPTAVELVSDLHFNIKRFSSCGWKALPSNLIRKIKRNNHILITFLKKMFSLK